VHQKALCLCFVYLELGIPVVLADLLDFKYFTCAVIFEKDDDHVSYRIKLLQRVYQFLNRHVRQLLWESPPTLPDYTSGDECAA
jgi:hypothetical protein